MDIIDPNSERGQQIIADSAKEQPTTLGDPPPQDGWQPVATMGKHGERVIVDVKEPEAASGVFEASRRGNSVYVPALERDVDLMHVRGWMPLPLRGVDGGHSDNREPTTPANPNEQASQKPAIGEVGARLRALIAQWRETARRPIHPDHEDALKAYYEGQNWAWDRSADALEKELDALRSAPVVNQCPHGEDCACAISTRHEWFVAFCEERDTVLSAPVGSPPPQETKHD
jgi:hypothetical protein